VLENGPGSGYPSACLGRLARSVISLDIFPALSSAAASKLRATAAHNVELRTEDAMTASFDRKFDVVAVTASVPTMTRQFTRLLKPGGRLFVVVGRPPVMQAMSIRLLEDGSLTEKSLFETLLTPMINAALAEPFVL
jgi:protein-L-isoaspartate(D-aspartate) O-methyltransferase